MHSSLSIPQNLLTAHAIAGRLGLWPMQVHRSLRRLKAKPYIEIAGRAYYKPAVEKRILADREQRGLKTPKHS